MRLILTLLMITSSTLAFGFTRNQLVFPRGWNHAYGAVVLGEITEGDFAGSIRVRSNLAPYVEGAFLPQDLASFEDAVNSDARSRILPSDIIIYRLNDRVLGRETLRYARVIITFPDGTVQAEDLNPRTLPDNLSPLPRGVFTRGSSNERQQMVYVSAANISARPNGCPFQFKFAAQ